MLAGVLKLPPIAPTKQANPPVNSDKNSVNVKSSGTDWSGVVAAWLDATQAAETVSLITACNLSVFWVDCVLGGLCVKETRDLHCRGNKVPL